MFEEAGIPSTVKPKFDHFESSTTQIVQKIRGEEEGDMRRGGRR